jgi:DNA repair exonuclease SbcCD nuclease subunit
MWLIVGDLHLTEHLRDEYRFDIFKWLADQQRKLDVQATFLAGDLCDSKNRHSATLVNHLIDGLTSLRPPVYVCKGNHDYRDPTNPFFRFINHIDGLRFIVDPTVVTHGHSMAIIPHVRDQAVFDQAVADCEGADAFLVHQTFEGAIAETGARLNGLSASAIESLKPPLGVWAGDVHKPQRSGLVRYIGCPYHVRFGDAFSPRVVYLKADGKVKNLRFDAPYKHSLQIRDHNGLLNMDYLQKGDQVKITVELDREDAVNWKQIKAEIIQSCHKVGVSIHGLSLRLQAGKPTASRSTVRSVASPTDVFRTHIMGEGLGESYRRAGENIIEGVKCSSSTG